MNKRTLYIKLFGLMTIVLSSISSCWSQERVKVEGGWVKGVEEDGLTFYKGIPFATPPVGELRWKAPQPVKSWEGVREAKEFGPACPQMIIPNVASIINSVGRQSEDCLYLNVWTPAKSANDKLPVMVWIYGGGFAAGGTGVPNYSGENLAKKGVVLVSIAYRVGVFGFLAHPELSAESENHTSGNYGLLDQIAGLKWVKNNISVFGGDPENVTIFGQSAGGISVSMLCGSPLTGGLFQRAISQSGGAFGPVGNQGPTGTAPLKLAEQKGKEFIKRIGAKSIADLRAMPFEKFINDPATMMGGFWPICDGYVITDDQYKLYSQGKYNDVDVLIGTNSDEGAMFVFGITTEQLKGTLQRSYGAMAEKALEVYPATNNAVAVQSARNVFRDQMFAWPTWAWAKLQQQTGNSNVFMYYFDQKEPPMKNGIPIEGANHSDEINYVFGHVDKNFNFLYTDQDKELSSIIMKYWVNFATTGDPNGEGLPEWPQFNDQSEHAVMYFKNHKPYLGPVPNRTQLEFNEEYFKKVRETR